MWLTWQRTGPVNIDIAGRDDVMEMEVRGSQATQLASRKLARLPARCRRRCAA